jgi:hypothetical protein
MRITICLILATAILCGTTLEASESTAIAAPSSGSEPAEQAPNIKERLLEVPPGTMIQVRLLNKKKIRGKLGEIDNEGFNLRTVEGGKIVTQRIAFAELKSFKQVSSATSKAGHTVLYILAGLGAVMIVLIIWAATQTE